METIRLVYNGDRRFEEPRRGFIPGLTLPQGDRPAGLWPGESILITDELLASLNRPTGEQARSDFAEFLAGIYNANMKHERWTVSRENSAEIIPPISLAPPEPEIASGVQSEDEPEESAEGDEAVNDGAQSADEEETE